MLGDGTQILGPAWDMIKTNFTSGTYFWAILILLDFAIAAYRYHKTREISEFVKTLILMIIITVGVGMIFTYAGGT